MSTQRLRSTEKEPTRSSRRIQGLAPQVEMTATKAVYLPPELRVAVLAQLEKRDLKAVRLVSKEWNALATRPLFDKVYISGRVKDMEVFKNITRHPVISAGIKELVYDGSLFIKDIDFEDYFEKISDELTVFVHQVQPDTTFGSADVQIKKFLKYCKRQSVSFSKLYKAHGKDTFLVEGYRKYRDCSASECHSIESGLLFHDLCLGLGYLKNLRSVVLSHNFWDDSLYDNEYFRTPDSGKSYGTLSGPPLCRIWNPFHLHPIAWRMLPNVDDGTSRFSAHFHILTRALRATDNGITSLQFLDGYLGGGLPPQLWIGSKMTCTDFWHLGTTYSSLRCLDIHIITNKFEPRAALTILAELLAQTRGLRRLSLELMPDAYPLHVSNKYRYDEIFPLTGGWPKLTELSLSGVAIGGWDLLKLILGRARLEQLRLSDIDLLDGTWEGVIEGMRRVSRLTEVKLYHRLTHCGGTGFGPCDPKRNDWRFRWNFLHKVESYVVYGGRHPCLSPDCDTDTAIWWYFDMMPEKDIDELILFARENNPDIKDIFRNRR